MDIFSYQTVQNKGMSTYKEKGSKFLAFAFPVKSEAHAKTHIDQLRKEYHDARHHCFAWVIGADRSQFRASDDGEPNHTAGDPILGQIRSRNLTNVLVVVVRYFGGVKLGVSGLIAAYRAAAHDALEKAGIIEKEITQELSIRYEYAYTPEVMRLIKDFELTIVRQDYQRDCYISAKIKLKLKEVFLEKTSVLIATGTDLEIEWSNVTL